MINVTIWIAVLLLCSQNSSAQFISECKLESLSTAGYNSITGVFANHLTSNSYGGALFRIRRGSDDVESDFYADTWGNLGTGILAVGISYTTWIGSATGYITIWYDQSKKKYNATQTTRGDQPIYNSLAKTIDFGGKRYMISPTGVINTGNNPYTFVTKLQTISSYSSYPTILSSGDDVDYQRQHFFAFGDGSFRDGWGGGHLCKLPPF